MDFVLIYHRPYRRIRDSQPEHQRSQHFFPDRFSLGLVTHPKIEGDEAVHTVFSGYGQARNCGPLLLWIHMPELGERELNSVLPPYAVNLARTDSPARVAGKSSADQIV